MSEITIVSSASHAAIGQQRNSPRGVAWVCLSFSGAGVYHLPIAGLTQQTMGLGWAVQTSVDGSTKVAQTLGAIIDNNPTEAVKFPWTNDVTIPNGSILQITAPITGLRITTTAACQVYITGR
jgi:hypothetical protein